MFKLEEQLNSILYNSRGRALGFLKLFSGLNVIVAIFLLVLRFGFLPDIEETLTIFNAYDICFLVFALVYITRLLFSLNRIEFFKKTWFEGYLNIIIIIHGMVNYLTDGFRILLWLVNQLEFSNPLLTFEHILSIYLVILVGLELTKITTRISDLQLKPASTFIYSFIILIFFGTLLLMLPAMTKGKGSMPFLEALFTAVSASCVTGLSVVDTGTYFTQKGQIILLFLIQLGGIGIVSFATFFATFLAKGVGLKHQSIIKDHLSSESLVSAKGLLTRVIQITMIIEILGAIFLFIAWDDELKFNTMGQKIFYSIFHSISAFCNAGFSLFSDGLFTNDISEGTAVFARESDINLRKMYLLHFIIAILIILGSIGFSTIEDIFTLNKTKKRFKNPNKEWRLSTKIAVYSTVILVSLGTIGFMFLEFSQLTDRTIIEALSTSFFQSVTTRTAGFHTMNFGGSPGGVPIGNPTIIMVIFLMFIGAAPGSTGGGIKSTTFYVLTMSAISNIKGQDRIEIGKRTIPDDLIRKAFSVFMFATTYNLIAVFVLSITESGNPAEIGILQLVFEQISAFATVGLSMGITSDLSAMGKVVIIISMYIGRVGTLTLALALSSKVITNSYRYPDGHVMVG